MARRNVITTPMFKYKRSSPTSPYLGWGNVAVRKATTVATSPGLLKYRGCIAGELGGKTYSNLEEVQKAFKAATQKCK